MGAPDVSTLAALAIVMIWLFEADCEMLTTTRLRIIIKKISIIVIVDRASTKPGQ
jgi:hypothetical protein